MSIMGGSMRGGGLGGGGMGARGSLGGGDDLPDRDRLFSIVRRLLVLAWANRAKCAVAFSWSVAAQILTLFGYVYSGLAIDILRESGRGEVEAAAGTSVTESAVNWPFGLAPPSDWNLVSLIAVASGVVLAVTLVQAVVQFAARLADERLVQAIIVDLRVHLYDKMQRMGWDFFDANDSGTLINRVTADASSVRLFIQSVVIRMVITAATIALFLGYLARQHAGLTLSVSALFIVQAVIVRRYAVVIRPRFRVMRETMDRLIQRLQEMILGARTIRGFAQEAQVVSALDERNDEARDRYFSIVKTNAGYMPAIPAMNSMQLAILLGYGGYLVWIGPEGGGIALGTLWVFFGLIRQISQHVDRIVQSAATIPEAITSADRVFELLDVPVGMSHADTPYSPEQVNGEVRFEAVGYRYEMEREGPEALRDIELKVKASETIALVGPPGSGKSTLLHLVGRYREATSGRMLIDGIDVREWDVQALRRCVALVHQEAFLFSTSIRENLRFGQPDADDELVREVAEAAGALPFIEATRHGFETVVGERGHLLSGGERQRLSLARTLLTEPAILLLDDTMSAVDARTEALIQEALATRLASRTTIIVSHRLSTIRHADRIVVLSNGTVEAMGTHEELMEQSEHYRRAAEIQLSRGAEDDEQGGASL